MVFCCFDQTLEEEAISTLVVEDELVETRRAKEHDNTDNRKKVSVIVPDGIYAGYPIMVRSPDGKQVTQAIVPQHCGPGQSFFVTFPTYTPEVINVEPPQSGCVYDIDRLLTPNMSIPEVMGTHIVDDNDIVVEQETRRALDTINLENEGERESPEDEPTGSTLEPEEERGDAVPKQEPPATNSLVKMVSKALLLDNDDDDEDDEDAFKDLAQTPSAVTAPPRISMSLTDRMSKMASVKKLKESHKKPNKDTSPEEVAQKVLLVRVPAGVQPGSTIYVEIPGENRTVAASIPEGVSSFHVCYTPRVMPLLAPPERRMRAPRPENKLQLPPSQVQQRSMPILNVQQQPHDEESRNVPTTTAAVPTLSSPGGLQKLLLVRVPQGTRAGTTIHVSVPDEPGRILAAVVPAGDVREFHVSYESRIVPVDAPPSRAYLAPASPYRNHSPGDSGLDHSSNVFTPYRQY